MKARQSNVSIESIMVMLLLIGFAVSVSLMIMQGSQIFERTLESKENDENIRIAMSYVNMKVKQNDIKDKIYVVENAVEGRPALVIEHVEMEEGFYSYIFHADGYLYECWTDEVPTVELSMTIIPLEGIRFDEDSKKGQFLVTYDKMDGEEKIQIEQLITLRSGR